MNKNKVVNPDQPTGKICVEVSRWRLAVDSVNRLHPYNFISFNFIKLCVIHYGYCLITHGEESEYRDEYITYFATSLWFALLLDFTICIACWQDSVASST